MASPVVSSITFDRPGGYSPGQVITATVSYSISSGAAAQYQVKGTVTNTATGETGTLTASFAMGSQAGTGSASLSGGEPGQSWARQSDDGHGTAVFTAVAS